MGIYITIILTALLFILAVHFSGMKRKYTSKMAYWLVFYLISAVFILAVAKEQAIAILIIISSLFVIAYLTFLFQKQGVLFQLQTVKQQSLHNIYQSLKSETPLPILHGWTITPELGSVYVDEILHKKPSLIVEAGSGTSTILSGLACKRNGKGRVIALDHDENYSKITAEMIKKYDLDDYCTVYHCPLKKYDIEGESFSWYNIDALEIQEKSIDILLVDGPFEKANKLARYPAYPLLKPFLSEGVTIVVDDADRKDETEMIRRWLVDLEGYQKISHESEKGVSVLKI
jgi:predicted O-methyltransferase YrrM